MNQIFYMGANPTDITAIRVELGHPNPIKELLTKLNKATDDMLGIKDTRIAHFSVLGAFVNEASQLPVESAQLKNRDVISIHRFFSFDEPEQDDELGEINAYIHLEVTDNAIFVRNIVLEAPDDDVPDDGTVIDALKQCKYTLHQWLSINFFFGELNRVIKYVGDVDQHCFNDYIDYITDRPHVVAVGGTATRHENEADPE